MSEAVLPARRYLSLWLERLATDRIERGMSPEARAHPRVTVASEKSALRLCALNPAARARGLSGGLALADARARYPDLDVREADPQADLRLLEGFADACERYTPLLALDPPDGLLLDISGCAHLFGGEAGLLRDLIARTQASGFAARAGIAATPEAAAALARFAPAAQRIAPAGSDLAACLASFPLAALRPEPQAAAALARLGLTVVGDLADRPRAPLAARFGSALLARYDAATGQARTALDHRFPPPRFSVEKPLQEPIERVEDVLGLTLHLAGMLAAALERHGLGGRRFRLSLFRVDGKLTRLEVGSARPVRDASFIRRLFAEKVAAIDSLDAGFGFDLLRLTAPLTEPLAARQEDFDSAREADLALDSLLDRLGARLGPGHVVIPACADDHQPEGEGRMRPLTARGAFDPRILDAPTAGEADLIGPARPARLFARPEPVEAVAEVPDGPPTRFRWRRLVHEVAAAEGPERIAAPWWREEGLSLTRDYFRIETVEGRRLWLFRAGLYGRETERPAWYVHGLFG